MDNQLLDKKRIDKLISNGDPSFFREMIELFEERSLALVKELQLLHADSHIREAARILHALKGISLTVGAAAIAQVCTQAEKDLKNLSSSDLQKVAGSVATLRLASLEQMKEFLS